MVTKAGVKMTDPNESAVEAAKVTLMQDFGDMLSFQLIDLIAYSAVTGARITIEGEQRVKDAAIAIGNGTHEVLPNGVTSIDGSWQRIKYGAVVAEDILREGPNYVTPSVIEVQPEPPVASLGPIRKFGRRVITGPNPRYHVGHINIMIDNVLVSEEELLAMDYSTPESVEEIDSAEDKLIAPVTEPEALAPPQSFFPAPPTMFAAPEMAQQI